mmetsp:Transcript_7133/g.16723  ORF Transcript_7133/g.16723 Transcript_7133/m.16723 type:complete len:223 (-) Transcript_7133:215-883(-)
MSSCKLPSSWSRLPASIASMSFNTSACAPLACVPCALASCCSHTSCIASQKGRRGSSSCAISMMSPRTSASSRWLSESKTRSGSCILASSASEGSKPSSSSARLSASTSIGLARPSCTRRFTRTLDCSSWNSSSRFAWSSKAICSRSRSRSRRSSSYASLSTSRCSRARFTFSSSTCISSFFRLLPSLDSSSIPRERSLSTFLPHTNDSARLGSCHGLSWLL